MKMMTMLEALKELHELNEDRESPIKLSAYHTSKIKFSAFDIAKVDTGTTDGGMYGNGLYFTNDINLAKSWNNHGYLYKVELNFNNPYICKTEKDREKLGDILHSTIINNYNNHDTDELLKLGYDSIVSYNEPWDNGVSTEYFDQYVAFYNNQIKIIDCVEYGDE